MKRYLLTCVLWTGTLLFAASLAAASLARERAGRTVAEKTGEWLDVDSGNVSDYCGSLSIRGNEITLDFIEWSYSNGGPRQRIQERCTLFGFPGIDWQQTYGPNPRPSRPMNDDGQMFAMLRVSLWYLVALSSVAPITLVVRYSRGVKTSPGHCPDCGYDLRASKDRCPECGRAMTVAPM